MGDVGGAGGRALQVGAQWMGDDGGPKRFARRAEAAGFDSVWCGDHLGHLVDGLSALGILAGATEEIRIGLNLLVLPYRPAVVAAKGIATVAEVAPGRVIAGFGVGGEFPLEFDAAGAELRRRGAYADDALELIRALWAGEDVSHHSRWVDVDGFRIEPPPTPVPPVLIGGRSDAALRRAVRFGDGYAPYLVSPDHVRRRWARLGELATEAGRDLSGFTLACLVTLIPAPSVDAAVERGLTSLRLSGLSPDAVRAMYLLGDDATVLARIGEYVAAGVDHLILGCPPGTPADVDGFFAAAARLLPAIRAAHGGVTG